jgi:hypothetical protein
MVPPMTTDLMSLHRSIVDNSFVACRLTSEREKAGMRTTLRGRSRSNGVRRGPGPSSNVNTKARALLQICLSL